MAESEVAICNQALTMLGSATIEALSDNNTRAQFCNAQYANVRDEVLRMHPWNCAVHRASVAASGSDPSFQYSYQYRLPTDPYCLRLLSIYQTDTIYAWRVEGRFILTDRPAPLQIKYIGRVTNPLHFDPLLSNAIAIRMAALGAIPLMQDFKAAAMFEEMFRRALADARFMNAGENSPRKPNQKGWRAASRGGASTTV